MKKRFLLILFCFYLFLGVPYGQLSQKKQTDSMSIHIPNYAAPEKVISNNYRQEVQTGYQKNKGIIVGVIVGVVLLFALLK